MVVSNRNILFQGSIFRCYVSFREGIYILLQKLCDLLLPRLDTFRLPAHRQSGDPKKRCGGGVNLEGYCPCVEEVLIYNELY